MLPHTHDCEDAFQATFLVLARRAASIRRREQLASRIYGVAVRTAKEARRPAARARAKERRPMEISSVHTQNAEDRDDLLACLDEELNRLPARYQAALVACELEGKSRCEAAKELGLPEGTLSTHLARGRKLLRERLQRRGVNLEAGPLTALLRPTALSAVPERLLGATFRAALGGTSRCATAGAVSNAVSTLARRVLKMMLLAKLALVDPAAARAVLEQIKARAGLDPMTLGLVGQPWLTAWGLVDLKEAERLVEAGLPLLDAQKEPDLWNFGFLQMVQLLATPPARREAALGERSFGGYWWPGHEL
jgi:RNA polymerase sigma factor (sigma-70 family)